MAVYVNEIKKNVAEKVSDKKDTKKATPKKKEQ